MKTGVGPSNGVKSEDQFVVESVGHATKFGVTALPRTHDSQCENEGGAPHFDHYSGAVGRNSRSAGRGPGFRPILLTAFLIFVGTYLVMAVGRLPGFRVDRTGAAIVGASLMLAANILSVEEAYAAINYDTIMLLFGMMIVVANLRLSGFFAVVSNWVVEHAGRPLLLLSGIAAVSGFFSAFFVNDTMCLVLTPLVLDITQRL